MTTPSACVVVVAYGHAEHLPATLRAVAAQEPRGGRIEVVVVDNGDGTSAEAVRATLPSALVLHPGANLGFAGGCNLAVGRTSADVVVLVNPDVELRPDFLRVLLPALDDIDAGVVGGKLMFPDGKTIQHAGGELRLPLALTSHRGYGEVDSLAHEAVVDVDYVTGAALALRRSVWKELGGLDEAFAPAYFEEVDLCMRARAAGLAVRYIPGAVATHREASGLGRTSIAYYRLYHLNRLRLLFKHWDDRFLAAEWLPAELRHLRTTADDNEVDGLTWSYGRWQAHFLQRRPAPDLRITEWSDPPSEAEPPPGSGLAWTLAQAEAKRTVTPHPFRSRIAAVARARGWWNKIATEEYLRPIVQQQNDLNATLVELAQGLERQRRTADAAVLCQGMLLAKTLGGLK